MVLINRDTASAAEILAAALQDYGLATLVGTRTYGKNTVQEVLNLAAGGALDLTIGEYVTSEGESLAGQRRPARRRPPRTTRARRADEGRDAGLDELELAAGGLMAADRQAPERLRRGGREARKVPRRRADLRARARRSRWPAAIVPIGAMALAERGADRRARDRRTSARPSGPPTSSRRCSGRAASSAASPTPLEEEAQPPRPRTPRPRPERARPDRARHLHGRPRHRPRLRRRRLGAAGRRRAPPVDPHRRRRRPRPPRLGLEAEAYARGTSVYVPGTVEPMLPAALSGEACSLAPGVERLAVTMEVALSATGEPARPRFYRSRIRSDARLDYDQLDRVFAGREAAARDRRRPARARARGRRPCSPTGAGDPRWRSRAPSRSSSSTLTARSPARGRASRPRRTG